jgi:superfamily II DNA or RNA helicase
MQIEKYLVLNKYLLSLFGVRDFKVLQEKLRDVKEDIDSDGRSYFLNTLLALKDLKIPDNDLIRYDQNIQSYVKRISEKRETFSLKYFQYLALLFTEIFLENIKNRKAEFLYNLNEFLYNYEDRNVKELIGEFNEEDFKKLAYWMATGSGKTLIAHINYYQFLNYKLFEPDNILFITPNLSLSKQHFEELQKSGIPARLYSEGARTEFKRDYEILIIEITKLVEEKKGGGLSLPVETFEGKNLIFVDEGHKGQRSEDQKWAQRRNKLLENGFAFEYSATFGQILDRNNNETLKEYAKAIIFDYSYKYFYLDGYGKDFWVFNVKENKIPDQEFQETIFVANLLDFYEQLLLYQSKPELCKKYNIEKPLWIFVGTTVTGKNVESDILQIVKFLKNTLDTDWLEDKIRKILNKEYKNEKGEDLFENKFPLLRKGLDLDNLYKTVFHGKGAFKIYEIKNADGEFGLKVGENPYFGVINVGNVSDFKKLLTQENFTVEQDVISTSLFGNIKKENSPINILIGAKKFIEGWDTWRVSSMGLLHIGRGEGPQIIQLFGRGVRLKGENMSLKRSGNPEVKPLETLNIYGIKADYIEKFLKAIAKEGVELEEISISVKVMDKSRWQDLPYLTKDETKKFEEEVFLKLHADEKIYFTLNLVPTVSVYVGDRKEAEINPTSFEVRPEIQEISVYDFIDIEVLNWTKILKEMIDYKILKGYWNLSFDVEALKESLKQCKIRAIPEFFKIKDSQSLAKIEDITILLIKGYIDKFYKKHKGIFETSNLKYRRSVEQLKLFASDSRVEYYRVYIDKKETQLIEQIKALAERLDELLKDDKELLPRVVIDNSIFIPLLLKNEKIKKISPPGLTESEEKFVSDLKKFLKANSKNLAQYEIILLRNESQSGIGFQLDWAGFYPDFIMWIKDKGKTHIVFIDPKGLHHTHKLEDEKVKFIKEELKDIERNLDNNVCLYGFILSYTRYEDLIRGMEEVPSQTEFEENNILFLDDKDWPKKLFSNILNIEKKI